MTPKRMADKINSLSMKEKNKILKNLHKARPMIKNTFGFDALPLIRAQLDRNDSLFHSAIHGDNSTKTYPRAAIPKDVFTHIRGLEFTLTDMTSFNLCNEGDEASIALTCFEQRPCFLGWKSSRLFTY